MVFKLIFFQMARKKTKDKQEMLTRRLKPVAPEREVAIAVLERASSPS